MQYIIDNNIIDLRIGEKELCIIKNIFEILETEKLTIRQAQDILEACKYMTLNCTIN